MGTDSPVIEISAHFVDDVVAGEVAEALGAWFDWILGGSEAPMPACFEPLGVDSEAYAWRLEDDVDWNFGPHARAVGNVVRIALETHDTHLHIVGLLRRLGAVRTHVVR